MIGLAAGRKKGSFYSFYQYKNLPLYDILIPKVENYAVMQLDMENDMEVREQENAISVRDVTKVYRLYDKPIDRLKESMSISHKNYHRDFYALSGLSFQVKKGETVGIIGTNGSGKSTILKIITGVLTPTTGQVDVNGKISALFGAGSRFLIWIYTGIENIYMNGTMMGYTKKEMDAKLQDILEFCGHWRLYSTSL